MSMRKLINLFVDREGRRRSRRDRDAGRSLGLESLEGRAVPAVTALVQGTQLIVSGDAFDNTITISRDATGTILVNDNNGQVPITGRTPTVANTAALLVLGGSGNDTISLDETNGALPRARLLGGDGNDVLTGGSGADVLLGQQGDDILRGMGGSDQLVGDEGNDVIDGGTGDDRLSGGEGNDILNGDEGIDVVSGDQGDDVLMGGAGDDIFEWSPGDGNDVIDGQAGFDALQFNGSDDAERIDLSADHGRLQVTRDVDTVTLNVIGVEAVNVSPAGGADTITVNDLSGTDVTDVHIDLVAFDGGGDGQVDTVIVNGTHGDDNIRVAQGNIAGDASTTVLGLAARVDIVNVETAFDRLTVNALNGDDTVDASGLPADAILLTEDGGNGDDLLIGGDGDDTLLGANGDDALIGGPGQDLLDGGHGDNHLLQD